MKNRFAPSVVRDRMNQFAIAFLLTLVFFFTENATSVFAKAERCKVSATYPQPVAGLDLDAGLVESVDLI